MCRYRAKKRQQGYVRRDVLLSPEEKRAVSVQKQISTLVDSQGAFRRALVTINVPRPEPIDGATLLKALIEPQAQWRTNVEAFFTEVEQETLHDIKQGGIAH